MSFAKYRHQSQAQFQVLMEQVKTQDDKLEAMIVGIQPVLDCVGLEQPEGGRLPYDGPYRSVMDHCWIASAGFKEFVRSAAHGAAVHPLAQLRSHYPSVDLQWVATGYA